MATLTSSLRLQATALTEQLLPAPQFHLSLLAAVLLPALAAQAAA
jgi:hypothetical protein